MEEISSRQSKSSYLDQLHESELRQVFRHLSARPRTSNWQSEVSAHDALNVLRSGGPLADCAREELLQLSNLTSLSDRQALIVNEFAEKGTTLFEDILVELAPYLRGLYIDCFALSRRVKTSEPSYQCKALQSLHVDGQLEVGQLRGILEAASGNLRELSIAGFFLSTDTINAIAEHCVGLEMFDVQYERVGGDLSTIWKTIGPTLLDLSIYMDALDISNGLGVIDEIVSSCVKVRSFGYGSWNNARAPLLVHLCLNLSSQLKSLRYLTSELLPSPTQIGKILDACPDLVVDACFRNDELEMLEVFRDRLRAVEIEIDEALVLDVEQAGRSVPSLEKLSLTVCEPSDSESFLLRFLPGPKPLLKNLHIDHADCPLEDFNNPLEIIARFVTTIEILSVETSRITPGVFQDIARVNSFLKRVSVSCTLYQVRPDPQGEEAAAVSFVEDFSQCPMLDELLLKNNRLPQESMTIADACRKYRDRQVDIFIGGRQYAR